jgi:hypothetical protein
LAAELDQTRETRPPSKLLHFIFSLPFQERSDSGEEIGFVLFYRMAGVSKNPLLNPPWTRISEWTERRSLPDFDEFSVLEYFVSVCPLADGSPLQRPPRFGGPITAFPRYEARRVQSQTIIDTSEQMGQEEQASSEIQAPPDAQSAEVFLVTKLDQGSGDGLPVEHFLVADGVIHSLADIYSIVSTKIRDVATSLESLFAATRELHTFDPDA